MSAKQIAARATATKWGGKTPEVRDLARDVLDLLGEVQDLREQLADQVHNIRHQVVIDLLENCNDDSSLEYVVWIAQGRTGLEPR